MDNPTFVHDEDIPLINDDDYDEEESRYDTPDSSRIEETSFTEQPAVRLRQRNRLLRNYLEDLYKYLDVDGNIDLVDTNLFKVEKSKSGAVEFSFYNGEEWVSLTNKRTGNFLAKSTIRNKFGGIERMKRILTIEGDIPDFNQSVTFAQKNYKSNYQLIWKWKTFHCKILVILQSKYILLLGKQQPTQTSI